MSRRPRLFLPDTPIHVIQRGHNRLPCFFSEADYRYYRHWLRKYADATACAVHAYVLMTNHVHLLLTPQDLHGPSRLMQNLGMRYVAYVNRVQARRGTLWEGRFRASPVETESYLNCLYRYIELNPVRAGMVKDPVDYPWSSFRHNALGISDEVVTAHPDYLQLGETPESRHKAYRKRFDSSIEPDTLEVIRHAAVGGLPIGSDRFNAAIERASGMALRRPMGRPRQANLPEISCKLGLPLLEE